MVKRSVFVPYWCKETSTFGWVREGREDCPKCESKLRESNGEQGERILRCVGPHPELDLLDELRGEQ